jgi:hypothetical protein
MNKPLRSSNRLREDEGTALLTKVLGAPFQVLGMRNASGELIPWVPSNPGYRAVEAKFASCVALGMLEILNGPEADDLIARITEQRAGSDA